MMEETIPRIPANDTSFRMVMNAVMEETGEYRRKIRVNPKSNIMLEFIRLTCPSCLDRRKYLLSKCAHETPCRPIPKAILSRAVTCKHTNDIVTTISNADYHAICAFMSKILNYPVVLLTISFSKKHRVPKHCKLTFPENSSEWESTGIVWAMYHSPQKTYIEALYFYDKPIEIDSIASDFVSTFCNMVNSDAKPTC